MPCVSSLTTAGLNTTYGIQICIWVLGVIVNFSFSVHWVCIIEVSI